MKIDIIIKALNDALNKLYIEDNFLINNKVDEINIISTLKCYLKETWAFNEYKIDVEYNREGVNQDSKRFTNKKIKRADLIIHKTRGDTINWNLIFLEAKTYYNANEANINKDKDAIKFFLNKFKYEYWVFLFLWEQLSDTYIEVIVSPNNDFSEKHIWPFIT